MKERKTKFVIGVLCVLISYVCINSLLKTTCPELFVWSDEDREDRSWSESSNSFLDRKACRWIGLCGLAHVELGDPNLTNNVQNMPLQSGSDSPIDEHPWHQGPESSDNWSENERLLRKIPDYVLQHAPLVHLYSKEQFWPSDLAEHLLHTIPTLNYTPLDRHRQKPTLDNLDKLNDFEHGRWVFLTSKDDPERRPAWLASEENIPKEPKSLLDEIEIREKVIEPLGKRSSSTKRSYAKQEPLRGSDHLSDQMSSEDKQQSVTDHLRGGRSNAPGYLIVVDKGHGIVDAFWFFFYSFNLGLLVLNIRFGNHVGDWEHCAMRFQDGVPQSVYFSEHSFGSAYTYAAVEKAGKRPVIYSAIGSHAMYATPGSHPYILPLGILHDETDKGPLWDPTLNLRSFTYDYQNDTLRSSTLNAEAPVGWFYFAGHWGDKFYRLSDKRQYRIAGQYHYVNGPLGPRFKNLGRKNICGGRDSSPCAIKHWLTDRERIRYDRGVGGGDELSAQDIEMFFGGST